MCGRRLEVYSRKSHESEKYVIVKFWGGLICNPFVPENKIFRQHVLAHQDIL
jgi:hypothetical protein